MPKKLSEGDKVDHIWINDREFFKIGMGGVTSIEVVLIPGQMAPVPWFAVMNGDTTASLWNSANIRGVVYTDDFNIDD
jgi:hypothetical protein